jgi:hypothetical protein
MSSHKGPLTIDQGTFWKKLYLNCFQFINNKTKFIKTGCETPVYLSLLPENTNIKGEFLAEKKILDWTDLNWTWS